MRALTFSLYRCARDTQAIPQTASWEEWRKVLTTHEHRGNPPDADSLARLNEGKDGPCVVLGEIEAGANHTNANVLSVHAIGLDIEDVTEAQILAASQNLREFEWVMATTHKHASPRVNEDPTRRNRVRIVVPLAEPIKPLAHKAAWKALDLLVGGIADKKTGNVGRLFYLPSTYDPSVAWAHHNPGRWMTLADLTPSTATPSLDPTSPGEPRPIAADMARIQATLKAVRVDDVELKEMARALLAAEPFAGKGDRHNAILSISLWLAKKFEDDPPSLGAVLNTFRPSITAMQAADPDSPGLGDVEKGWLGALAKLPEWRDEQKQARLQEAMDAQLKKGDPGASRYEDADLERIATVAGVPFVPGEAAVALQKRWIIHAGEAAFYLLHREGGYRGPFGPSHGRTAAVRMLAPAPVLLNEPTRNGYRRRTLQELSEDYGSAAAHITIDLTASISTYDDSDNTLYEAACPLRKHLVPKFDEQIDAWLHALAGNVYPKLCDWLACAPDLKKLLCAIYFSGEASAGKTLFAQSLAYLWSDTPARFDLVLSAFNEELLRCPLVFADEDMEVPGYRRNGLSGQIRSMLSTLERTVTRKYLPPAALHGALRLILAANNDTLLATKESLTQHDLTALAQRFLYIRTTPAAADIMAATPRETKEAWKHGGLASHALWLAQNRTVTAGRRFWVEGDLTQMHRMLTLTNDWTAKVCEWLIRYLLSPSMFNQRGDGLVRLTAGKLLVNEQAILDGWKIYFPDTRVEPETAKIGAALRSISTAERPQLRWKGKHLRYRMIATDTLLAWSDANGIGDRRTLLTALGTSEEREPGVDVEPFDPNATDDLESVVTANSTATPF